MQMFHRLLRIERTSLTKSTKAHALRDAQLFLKSLTAGAVLKFCEDAEVLMSQDSNRGEMLVQVLLDKAHIAYSAGDYSFALDNLLQAQSILKRQGKERIELEQNASFLKNLPLNEVDYSRKLYAHPHYWASFILVGDAV